MAATIALDEQAMAAEKDEEAAAGEQTRRNRKNVHPNHALRAKLRCLHVGIAIYPSSACWYRRFGQSDLVLQPQENASPSFPRPRCQRWSFKTLE